MRGKCNQDTLYEKNLLLIRGEEECLSYLVRLDIRVRNTCHFVTQKYQIRVHNENHPRSWLTYNIPLFVSTVSSAYNISLLSLA